MTYYHRFDLHPQLALKNGDLIIYKKIDEPITSFYKGAKIMKVEDNKLIVQLLRKQYYDKERIYYYYTEEKVLKEEFLTIYEDIKINIIYLYDEYSRLKYGEEKK
jgi:hypothetical protein